MSLSSVVQFDTIRSLASGSISGTYAAVGTALTHPARKMRLINSTDGDMFFSDDGTNNKWFVPAGSYVLYDFDNSSVGGGPAMRFPKGSQIYVKQSSAPTKNAVYVELEYAKGE